MKLLLDTHLLLWLETNLNRIPQRATRLLYDSENKLFFSVSNLWEVVIKWNFGRPDFNVDPNILRRALFDTGFRELPIRSEHVLAVQALPALHRDSFDRLLIAQATVEGLLLLTSDAIVSRYPGPIRKI